MTGGWAVILQGADGADLDVNSTVPVTAPQESPRYGLKAAKPQVSASLTLTPWRLV